MLAVAKYGERRGQHTFIIVLLIPSRIAWYILGSLLLLVLLALEHLLKELELRVNSCYQE